MSDEQGISDEDLLAELWHWRIEDGLNWKFCAGMLKQDRDIEMEPKEVAKRFNRALKKYGEPSQE